MNNKLSSNKGVSLIEIIVSLAIVSIMIFPIMSIVNTSIKTNKKSEDRQQAILLGQQILEEIDIINELNLDKINLSGGIIIGSESNNIEYLKYNTDAYKKGNSTYSVNLELEKNKDIQFRNYTIDSEVEDIEDKFMLSTQEQDSNIFIQKNDDIKHNISVDLNNPEIYIDFINNNGKIKMVIKNNDIDNLEYNLDDNKVILNFTNQYKKKNGLTINIKNRLDKDIKVYIQKSYDCYEKVYVQKYSESIDVQNIRDNLEQEETKINNLYSINVIIRKDNKELFNGHANKNIKIND